MKKVLSFVLVLSLVLGSFSMAFAATPTDVVGKDCETAVQALSDLGVVSGYTDGTYKPENPVNRAEACKLIISALGLDAYAAGITATSFTDLDGYGWAVGYIGYAERLGLVKGVGNGKFNPGGPVTYEQWATMLVRALGYTDEVLPGAWPANYMIKAQSLGIMKNIKAAGNAAANRGDVAIMLYNDLDQAIGTIDKDGVFQPNRGKWDDTKQAYLADTMLSRLEKASTAEFGILTEDALVDAADGVNLRKFLGASVKMYKNDDDDFIGVKDCESTFLTGDLNAAGDTFTVDDVDYTVKAAAQNTDVVYEFVNGECNDTTTAGIKGHYADTSNITLAAKVSGKTITKVFSVLTWDVTANTSVADQFESGDLNTAKAKLFSKEFAKNNNDEIDLTSFELVGVSSLDKIAEDNVVEVYLDSTKTIRKVAVGTTVVEGAVSKINKDGKKFTINGTTYKKTDYLSNAPELSDEGKAYLNHEGKFAFWDETDSTADNYAILIAGDDSQSFGDTTVSVKLFTKEGKEVELDLKDSDLKAKGDYTGFVFDQTTSACNIAANSLIRYGLDSKGKVDEIYTFSNGATVTGKPGKSGTTIGGKSVKDSVVVFIYDTDEEEWTLGTMKDLDTDKGVELGRFAGVPYAALDKNNKIAAVALKDTATSEEATYGVINGYYTGVNASNDKYCGVEGFNDGKEINALTNKKAVSGENVADTLKAVGFTEDPAGAPDLQKIKVNGSGEVTMVTTAVIAADEIEAILDWQEVSKVDRSRNELTVTDGAVETVVVIDKNAVVYRWDSEDEEYSLVDFNNIAKEDVVKLYQRDKDGVDGYDIVLVVEP